ncbi:hypothetical protein [Rossellomorea sp. YZS02]|uniref:hypothetical protein n=1 Tax=Rossellomorea sp. YZS02 TaxID=3097358 RepID=UPI002A1836B5|nr:hypothetical protein [Rossellomorea sp. YZS02]MDX8344655.1 hypothetical protein [Rossellomorea sp. YZS02]
MVTAYLLIIMIALSLLALPSLPMLEWAIFTVVLTVFVLAMRYLMTGKSLLISTSVAFLLALATVYTLNKLISIEIPYFFVYFMGIVNFIYAISVKRTQ